jgi:hypothetical protein
MYVLLVRPSLFHVIIKNYFSCVSKSVLCFPDWLFRIRMKLRNHNFSCNVMKVRDIYCSKNVNKEFNYLLFMLLIIRPLRDI